MGLGSQNYHTWVINGSGFHFFSLGFYFWAAILDLFKFFKWKNICYDLRYFLSIAELIVVILYILYLNTYMKLSQEAEFWYLIPNLRYSFAKLKN